MRKRLAILTALIPALATIAAMAASGPPTIQHNGPGTSSHLTVSPANARGLKHSTLKFTAFRNDEIANGPVKWSSSNPAVATIDATGSAQLLETGTTAITVTHGGQQGSTVLAVTTAGAPVFSAQPTDSSVGAVIGAGKRVQVQLADLLGDPLPGVDIAVSIGANPTGKGVLTGTLTRTTDAGGTATFNDLTIDWLGEGYTLTATAAPASGTVTGTSAAFNERGVGDACLGPDTPACSSGCPDTDGDGLNDAWEIAGGIDLNGDGKIDAEHDLLLPGADPHTQDVYVQYDWMDYSTPGNACSRDSDCTGISLGHAGETCSGPKVLPAASGSCSYSCTVDADCVSRGVGHLTEQCSANACVHTHDPDLPKPDPLQAVVDSFAVHGINLHLLRGRALPHSLVTSFRQKSEMTSACEGASVADGAVGIGKYAESLYDLKAVSAMDPLKIAYHYALFSHYSGCDSIGDCAACPSSQNPDGSSKNRPTYGESGLAEVSGNDFLVSLGARFQDLLHEPGTFDVGSTFMHELGHNLGLRHGGGVDTLCTTVGAACPGAGVCTQIPQGKFCFGGEDIGAKPNYLSIMNYRYQFTGIQSASAPGGTIPVSQRLDYSEQTLPTGGNTPGYLDQSTVASFPFASDPGLGLNEPAGLGSGVADIFTFTDARESGVARPAPSQGPVDWDGDRAFNSTNVQADTNCGPPGFGDHLCNALRYPSLNGHTDWGPAGQNQFNYAFQCTAYGGPMGDGAASALWPLLQHEISTQVAMDAHLALPIRPVRVVVRPGCQSKAVAPGQSGMVSVALFGGNDFDVTEVDSGSLSFAGVQAASVSISDVDGDGKPDLVALFDMATFRLGPNASHAQLHGWLKNSQAFVGEDQIRVVTSMANENAICR